MSIGLIGFGDIERVSEGKLIAIGKIKGVIILNLEIKLADLILILYFPIGNDAG